MTIHQIRFGISTYLVPSPLRKVYKLCILRAMTQLNNLPFFTTKELGIAKNASNGNLKQYISRKLAKGDILSLKKGIYVTKEYLSSLSIEELSIYKELLATVIKQPSYISLEYALSKYQILPEMVASISSVTLSRPYVLNNYFGNYSYRSIKSDLFTGYEIKYYKNASYYFASKSKALFDYLYYKLSTIPLNENINLVEELRLNLESFLEKDWEDLETWCNISKLSKLKKIVENLRKNASNN